MTISRRTFGKLVLGAGAVAPVHFVSTAIAQPKPGDELVVGVWGGAQERIVREFCEKPLVEKYGCKVSYVLGGTPERRARAYSERGRPSFDVLYLNIFESRQAVKDGVTQAPTAAVPNFANLHDVAKLGGYGVAFNPVTIVYDKRKASKPVTSWKDIWNPEWKGRVAWPSYPGAQGTAGLLMAAKVWGGDEKNIDAAFGKIRELKPFAAIQGSQDQLYGMFDQGVADISIEFGSFTRFLCRDPQPEHRDRQPGRRPGHRHERGLHHGWHTEPEAGRGVDQLPPQRALHDGLRQADLLFAHGQEPRGSG
jgi:putative spermidine/putrescine transport system substrate-binding protein